MLLYIPITAREVTVCVYGTVDYEKDYSTNSTAKDIVSFDNSQLSNVMSWENYSKSDKHQHDVYYDTYVHNSDRVNADRKIKATWRKESEVKGIIIDIFDKSNVFAGRKTKSDSGKEQYFEGLVKKIKFEFHWKYKS